MGQASLPCTTNPPLLHLTMKLRLYRTENKKAGRRL